MDHFEQLANILRPEVINPTENKKKVFKELIKSYKTGLKSNDLNDVKKQVNIVVSIHKEWLNTVNQAVKKQDFNDVEGIDFNEFYHDFEYTIEKVYFKLKDKYHSLHWDLHGFNAYNV